MIYQIIYLSLNGIVLEIQQLVPERLTALQTLLKITNDLILNLLFAEVHLSGKLLDDSVLVFQLPLQSSK